MMKRFKLVVLLAVLFLGACQKSDVLVPGADGGVLGGKSILWTGFRAEGPETRAVAAAGKLWQPGDTIWIKFQNGTPALQDQVSLYASEWLTYANLVFLYVGQDEYADVKIGFDTDERWLAWSAIGTDCRAVAQDSVSLNFVWLEDEGSAGVKAEVLRGFGHVLGLGFEHKNPGAVIEFRDAAAVAEEYNLSPGDVQELITLYSADQTNFTAYDKSSVMTISIPRSLVTKPTMATNRNSELSEQDKAFVAELYPYGPTPIVKMVTTKQTVKFGIHKLQPIDVDWGDGVRETLPVSGYDGPEHIFEVYNPPVYNEVEHVYKDSGEHTIRFFGSDSALTLLTGMENGITLFEVESNRELVFLRCGMNSISTLDVSKCPGLKELDFLQNRLSVLDVSGNPLLINVQVADNPLVTLKMGNNPNLEFIGVPNCRLSSLDLSNLPGLMVLGACFNSISSLDLSHNPKLYNLDVDNNSLTSLDVSHNPDLQLVECYYNPFVSDDAELLNFVRSLPVRSNQAPGILTVDNQYAKDIIESVCDDKKWWVNVR